MDRYLRYIILVAFFNHTRSYFKESSSVQTYVHVARGLIMKLVGWGKKTEMWMGVEERER